MDTISRLEKLIDHRELYSAGISEWSVGMQIEHVLKSHIGIIRKLRTSEPGLEKQVFNLKRSAVLALGRFPRGVAKAPEATVPSEEIAEVKLRKLVDLARNQNIESSTIPTAAWFKHGIFGVMNKKTALKFSEVHLMHHAIIAEEIVANNIGK